MRKQEPRLLVETTQMSKQNGKTRKQMAILSGIRLT
jgi:hypothetical protein